MKNTRTHQVDISVLLSISANLTCDFYPSNDIHSLLLLSLMTITEYSHTIHYLTKENRIELAINFLDDLIENLIHNKIIDSSIGILLIHQRSDNKDVLYKILQSYINIKRKPHTPRVMETKSSRCIIL